MWLAKVAERQMIRPSFVPPAPIRLLRDRQAAAPRAAVPQRADPPARGRDRAQLLRRTTPTVELSDAGEVLLAHARSILVAVDTATEQTRRAAAGEVGRLAICYTPTLAAETLPRLVDELHGRYPAVVLQMCEMWQAESVSAVRTGRFDVGLARCPDIVDGVEYLRLREEPLGVVLGAAHPLAAQARVELSELARATLAIWPRTLSPGFYDLVVNFFRSQGFTGPIQEFEYLTSAVFHSDPAARSEIVRGGAFSVTFATQFDPVLDGFVWRPRRPGADGPGAPVLAHRGRRGDPELPGDGPRRRDWRRVARRRGARTRRITRSRQATQCSGCPSLNAIMASTTRSKSSAAPSGSPRSSE